MNQSLTKEQVQQRVSKNGKPLPLDKFTWDEKTRTFSSGVDGLVIDFRRMDNCTFVTVSHCVFTTGSCCTFTTGSNCAFNTEYGCAFYTGSGCIFNIWEYGYFHTINCFNNIVIIRDDIIRKIIKLSDLKNNKLVRLSHSHNPIYRDIKDIKIVDYSTMIINSTKQLDQYKIHKTYYIDGYFYRDNPQKVFIAEQDNLFAHGRSIKEAIADLEFKKLSKLGANEHIKRIIKQGYMSAQDYRFITGACEEGTNRFLDDNDLTWKDTKSIDEVIKLTKGNYGHDVFIRLLKENGYEIK